MTFGEKLQKLRKARGFSQEQLAEQLSVTRQTISKWELDQSTPELTCIAQLSETYGVSTDYLIKEDSNDTASAAPMATGTAAPPYPPLFLLGLVLFTLGFAGMMVFFILSAVNPAVARIDRYCFEGLIGYLICFQSVPYFLLLLAMAAVGMGLSIYTLVKRRRSS